MNVVIYGKAVTYRRIAISSIPDCDPNIMCRALPATIQIAKWFRLSDYREGTLAELDLEFAPPIQYLCGVTLEVVSPRGWGVVDCASLDPPLEPLMHRAGVPGHRLSSRYLSVRLGQLEGWFHV
jgi:hypothetical protein